MSYRRSCLTSKWRRYCAPAEELGAKWVGGAFEQPPVKLDAAIIFAPAGEIVPPALKAEVQVHTEVFPLVEANDALLALKQDAIKGAGVLVLDT